MIQSQRRQKLWILAVSWGSRAMAYSRKIGRYTYQWSDETLDAFKGEISLISISRVVTDTVIGFISDTIAYRLSILASKPVREQAYPMVVEFGDNYEVISGHNTVVWHLFNGSDGLACHVFTDEVLKDMPHLKVKDWQCMTGT